MNDSLLKFQFSTTQAHSFICSLFHNVNGEERERKDKISGAKFFQASMFFFLLCQAQHGHTEKKEEKTENNFANILRNILQKFEEKAKYHSEN